MEVLAVTTLLLLTAPVRRKTINGDGVRVQVLRGLSYWLTVITSADGAGARLPEDRAGRLCQATDAGLASPFR